MGIFLALNMVDGIHYQRKNGCNRLTLIKRVKQE